MRAIFEEACGLELGDFFARHIHGREDPDLEGLQQPTWVVPVGPDKKGAPVVDGDLPVMDEMNSMKSSGTSM